MIARLPFGNSELSQSMKSDLKFKVRFREASKKKCDKFVTQHI